MNKTPSIVITVKTSYLENESHPDKSHFVFAYQISIENTGRSSAKLLDRHWIISDSNGRDVTVRGEGVVGEQPELEPGAVFTYTSTAVIQTPVGVMKGQYRWITDEQEYFYTQIPQFTLSIPRTLH
ncbi:MAG TPA: Co2+/Mg2+ efflux protein ApaG [Crenotrichaceae bacterium]|nr:Co2+/Mg2+ efflux protein ApaG [Crenotrichaceae bacterium]